MPRPSDETKRQAQRLIESLNRKSPFDTLNISQELVRQLVDSESLVIAVRGVTRALLMAYHPDRSRKINATTRLQEISEAQENILADPEKARRNFLANKKTRSKQDPEITKALIGARIAETNSHERSLRVRQEIEQLYSAEAISRLREAKILVANNTGSLHTENSHVSIICHDGRTSMMPTKYTEITGTEQGFPKSLDSIQLFEGIVRHGVFVKEDGLIIFGNDGRVSEQDIEHHLNPNSWYEIRGTKSKSHDSRTLINYSLDQQYEEPIKLLGCIDEQEARSIRESISLRSPDNQPPEIRYEVTDGGITSETDFMPLWKRLSKLGQHTWNGLISKDSDNSFQPKLENGSYLLAEQSNGSKLVLGRIEYMSAEYF